MAWGKIMGAEKKNAESKEPVQLAHPNNVLWPGVWGDENSGVTEH